MDEVMRKKILAAIQDCRLVILKAAQFELGDDDVAWNTFRSRALKAFGEGGLEGHLEEIIRDAKPRKMVLSNVSLANK